MKILGVTIEDTLNWNVQVSDTVSRANRRIFMLRFLKAFYLPTSDLVTVYIGFVRPLLEYACPAWNGALTIAQSNKIENVQKRAFRIILGRYYISYSNALSMTKLQTLHARREELCLKFALKALKSDQSDWFKLNASTRNTRKSRICIEPKSKTERYRKSPVPYLTRLLNNA